MKNFQKGMAVLSAFLLTVSFASCTKPEKNDDEPKGGTLSFTEHNWTDWETVKEKTCTKDGLEKLVCHDEDCKEEKTRVIKAEHEWGEWTGSLDEICTKDAVLTRTCSDCSKTEKQTVSARGHAYDEKTATCTVCEIPLSYPQISVSSYTDVWDIQAEHDGSAYNRKELSVDTYYTASLSASKSELWISVSVPKAGQYALFTVGGANGATVARHDASAHYIPSNDNGEYIGINAVSVSDGEFVSPVNCSEKHWSPSWRATWSIKASEDAEVKFVVKKVAEPAWVASAIYEQVSPKQLKKMKAPNGPDGLAPTEVPYDTEYFFDEWNEVYRMGTKAEPGAVIYMAVSTPAQRLLGEKAFTEIQNEGPNLNLGVGKTATGDNLIYEYAGFIGSAYSTEKNNSYDLFVNNNGLYPVNKELHDFLVLYTNANTPLDLPDEYKSSQSVKEEHAWLSACYYYTEVVQGSQAHPYEIGLGSHEITTLKFDYVYYKVKYEDSTNTTGVYYCTISCQDENAMMILDDTTYNGPFSVKVEVNPNLGKTLSLAGKNGAQMTYTITVEKASA